MQPQTFSASLLGVNGDSLREVCFCSVVQALALAERDPVTCCGALLLESLQPSHFSKDSDPKDAHVSVSGLLTVRTSKLSTLNHSEGHMMVLSW